MYHVHVYVRYFQLYIVLNSQHIQSSMIPLNCELTVEMLDRHYPSLLTTTLDNIHVINESYSKLLFVECSFMYITYF